MSVEEKKIGIVEKSEEDVHETVQMLEQLETISQKRRDAYKDLEPLVKKLKRLIDGELKKFKERGETLSADDLIQEIQEKLQEIRSKEEQLERLNQNESNILDKLIGDTGELQNLEKKLANTRDNL